MTVGSGVKPLRWFNIACASQTQGNLEMVCVLLDYGADVSGLIIVRFIDPPSLSPDIVESSEIIIPFSVAQSMHRSVAET